MLRATVKIVGLVCLLTVLAVFGAAFFSSWVNDRQAQVDSLTQRIEVLEEQLRQHELGAASDSEALSGRVDALEAFRVKYSDWATRLVAALNSRSSQPAPVSSGGTTDRCLQSIQRELQNESIARSLGDAPVSTGRLPGCP